MKLQFAISAIAAAWCTATGWAGQVGLIHIDGPIGPATASYIARAISVAAEQRDECLVVQLDTPGGLLDSTKDIVQAFYQAKVPVVVYVAPSGAYAASAGCFITMAADFAAMAPNTSIGAAHPVTMSPGGDTEKQDDVMKQKLENFGASEIAAIAKKRHRNVEWAESAVKSSASITEDKALKLNVIDIIADDLPDLLKQLNGRAYQGRKLATLGATVVPIPMIASEKVFQVLWRPEVMLLLMLVAIYGVIGELSSPGAILPGVAGAIALILFLYMSSILPVNIAGVALVVLAIVLFIVDVFAPTHGVLTFGGIVSFFLGALMLFNHAGPGFGLSLVWIIPATVLTGLFFIFVVGAGLRAQFRPVKAGRETLLGRTATALARIDSVQGKVFVEGEYWNAVSDAVIEKDQPVEVTDVQGLTLKVKPKTQ